MNSRSFAILCKYFLSYFALDHIFNLYPSFIFIMGFREKFTNKTSSMTSAELVVLLQKAYELKQALAENDVQKLKLLEDMKPMLLLCLEHLINSMGDPNVDMDLIYLLMDFLGIQMSKEEEEELEKEEEDRLTKEEKQKLMRFVIYEIYKVTNPRQIAGETALENFISNVKNRGLRVAMAYEGAELSKYFDKASLLSIESYGQEFKMLTDSLNVSVQTRGM